MLTWLQKRSLRDLITLVGVLMWSLSIVAVMLGGRPDWGLIMLVPYGCFVFLYEEESV